MWIMPHIELQMPAAHITGSFFATWGISCSMAVLLELLQRASFLRQQERQPADHQHGRHEPFKGIRGAQSPFKGRASHGYDSKR
jgi:hypothetical protein